MTALADGRVALAPAGLVLIDNETEYGWWLVGADGSVRDEMQSGRHQELAEYARPAANAAKQTPRIRQIGCLVAIAAIAASIAAAAVTEGPESFEAGGQTAELMDTLREIGNRENEFDEVEETCAALAGGGELPAVAAHEGPLHK